MILAPTLTLSAGSGAAIARPTFSRDFAGEKTLNNGTGPAITFTRASNATYFDANGVLQTASNDVPRFDHSGGTSLGLLIEEARQNLLQRSEEFDDAYWSKSSSGTGVAPVVTANAGTAPDGTATADRIDFDRGAGNLTDDHSWITRSLTVPATGDYTQSVWLKAATSGDVGKQIAIRNVGNSSYLVVTLTSDWVRCVRTENATTTTSRPWQIASRGGQTADNTVSVLAWGAQLEQGAFPTSYIPTTNAAVTRSADSAVVTPISSFYNQSEGTLLAEFQATTLSLLSGRARRIVSFDDNTGQVFVALTQNGSNNGVRFVSSISGSTQFDFTPSGSITDVCKGIVAFKQNDAIAAVNGTLTTNDTNATLPSVTHLLIGRSEATQQLQGYLRKIAYWPKRLSNTLLQQLTT